MAHLYRLTAFLCFLYPSLCFSQSAPVGAIDLAGWIKGADGVYSRAFIDGNGTRATPTNTTVNSTSTALVQTSKGLQSFDIQKTASVDVPRIGAIAAKWAKRVGPVGMTVTAASLVCELTTICDDAGKWMFGENVTTITELSCSTIGSGTYQYYSSTYSVYNKYKRVKHANCGGSVPSGWGFNNTCSDSVFGCAWPDSVIKELAGTSSPAPARHEATASDFDSKSSSLNDSRLAPHLAEAGEDVPTGVPTLTPGQKKQLGLDSVPAKDSNGNTTGREDTTTEIEALDAGTADNPGRVIIKETKTTIKYDTNNTQISSTTNTSYSSQPADKDPPQYTISFDSVPEATLQTYNVPNTFTSTSWGSGICPPNIDVTLTNFSFAIPTQPVCDTAEMINPFVLLLSSLIAVYIVAGVRGGNAT